jgi:protein-S-isoprenylcysteine O-methyltransferase Ste14
MIMKKMTRWGIGPKFALLTMLYAAFVYVVQTYIVPSWTFTGLEALGILLMVGGFLFFIYPAVTIDKYFNNGKLRTKGLYAVVRHPIYASWIIWIIPGIVIYWGSLLAITIPLVAYIILKKIIHVEEEYLAIKFGKEYLDYKARVNAVFPKIEF